MTCYAEEADNPAFSSMLESLWWGTTALTTVGYGDIYPITPTGKVLGSIAAFIGVGLFGMPAAILSSGFEEMWREGDTEGEDQGSRHGEKSRLASELQERMDKLEARMETEFQALRSDVRQILDVVNSLR